MFLILSAKTKHLIFLINFIIKEINNIMEKNSKSYILQSKKEKVFLIKIKICRAKLPT